MGVVLILYLLLAGCAHTAPTMTVDTLKAEGYQMQQRPYAQIWYKLDWWDERRMKFCAVPLTGTGGYNWKVTVFVDDQQEWSYDSGTWTASPTILQHGITCAVSDSLPPGNVTWTGGFRYFH